MPRPKPKDNFESPLSPTSWRRRLIGPMLVIVAALLIVQFSQHEVRFRGTVRIQGTPLSHVTLTFYDPDEKAIWQTITDEEGRYDSKGFDSGLKKVEYRITVTPIAETHREIPQRYRELNTTPLRLLPRGSDDVLNLNLL